MSLGRLVVHLDYSREPALSRDLSRLYLLIQSSPPNTKRSFHKVQLLLDCFRQEVLLPFLGKEEISRVEEEVQRRGFQEEESLSTEPARACLVRRPKLRNLVCCKVAKCLERVYGLAEATAREESLKMEGYIRALNPIMGINYKQYAWTFLKLLKRHSFTPE